MIMSLLLEVFRRSIFKLILAAYLLLELLPNDVTHWTAVAAFGSDEGSKEFINGKVLRVLIFHVLYRLVPYCVGQYFVMVNF